MCGIFGAIGYSNKLTMQLNLLHQRGPDDWGEYYDSVNQVYLGHRRLSIIDLSKSGQQPMTLEDKRYYLTYNGEIYNYLELKNNYLNNIKFKSQTDSEVLLNIYARFGSSTPQYLRGMFAFCVYDKEHRELFLCRDRIGIKPLYYYEKDGVFAFSSELNALKALPGVNLEIDFMGLSYYFKYGYIPAPFSAYKYIRKLNPAQYLIYNINKKKITSQEYYWRLKDNIVQSLYKTEDEWIQAIEEKIIESIKIRLMSDVPLGAFLSGGLDSSLVVALMSKLLKKPVKTFTIGFEEKKYDERIYADAVAKQYHTDHHIEIVNPNAIQILPDLVKSFGEPFADSSAIPTYYVSKIAKKELTVALTGDGGDEVFAGYERYARMYRYAKLQKIPLPIRKIVKHCGEFLPKHLPGYGFLQRQAYTNIELYHVMHGPGNAFNLNEMFNDNFKEKLLTEEKNYYEKILDEQNNFDEELITKLQLIDLNSYLPEDILTKVDRMSMLNSLETRVPFLDHELIELTFSCPTSIRFKNNNLKYIIKKLLKNKVSADVFYHKKTGFGIPLKHWFRNEFNHVIHDSIEKTKDEPILNNNHINKIVAQHLKGGRDFSSQLFLILFYKYWRLLDTNALCG